nr:MAG TPA: hypothetical protein [Caudoviricetes sp.]
MCRNGRWALHWKRLQPWAKCPAPAARSRRPSQGTWHGRSFTRTASILGRCPSTA